MAAAPTERRRIRVTACVAALTALAWAATSVNAPVAEGAEPRVHGGYYPQASYAPWVTSIESSQGGKCTASLIAADRVLTAAHCVVKDQVASHWTVRVGVRDRSDPSQGETRGVSGIAIHPNASLPESPGPHQHHAFYDLAVMFLQTPVSSPPATVGTGDDWAEVGTALGWGYSNLDYDNPQFDPRVKAVNLTLGSDQECLDYTTGADGVQHYFSAIHACAYDYEGDDCITHGDSGGPLVVDSGGLKLVGVTSFFPARYSWGECGTLSLIGFAWVAGPTLRSWPFEVANPGAGSGSGGGTGSGSGGAGGGTGAAGSPPVGELDLGKAKRNTRKGTANLTVRVGSPGEVVLTKTRGVKGQSRYAQIVGAVKIPILPRGKTKRTLLSKGSDIVRAEISFTPAGSTTPVVDEKFVRLRLGGG
jgi:hypothetical protein